MDDILKALELDKKAVAELAADTIINENILNELTADIKELLDDRSEPEESNNWELIDYPEPAEQLKFLAVEGLLEDWLQEHYNLDTVLAIREYFGIGE